MIRAGLIVGRLPFGGEYLIGYASELPPDPSALYEPPLERLAELAAMPYREYLRTPEWREKRRVEIGAAEHRCEECSITDTDRTLDIHHLTYVRRGREHPDDLRVLCRECHDRIHLSTREAP